MTALSWPVGLSADTPMPFSLWRVLDQVNGQRDAAELARRLNLNAQEVQQALDEAQRWVSRAAQREQPVTPESAQVVTQCLLAVVGPVASLMVDEQLEELGQKATMSGLLSGLAAQLSAERLNQFALQLRAKGLA